MCSWSTGKRQNARGSTPETGPSPMGRERGLEPPQSLGPPLSALRPGSQTRQLTSLPPKEPRQARRQCLAQDLPASTGNLGEKKRGERAPGGTFHTPGTALAGQAARGLRFHCGSAVRCPWPRAAPRPRSPGPSGEKGARLPRAGGGRAAGCGGGGSAAAGTQARVGPVGRGLSLSLEAEGAPRTAALGGRSPGAGGRHLTAGGGEAPQARRSGRARARRARVRAEGRRAPGVGQAGGARRGRPEARRPARGVRAARPGGAAPGPGPGRRNTCGGGGRGGRRRPPRPRAPRGVPAGPAAPAYLPGAASGLRRALRASRRPPPGREPGRA